MIENSLKILAWYRDKVAPFHAGDMFAGKRQTTGSENLNGATDIIL